MGAGRHHLILEAVRPHWCPSEQRVPRGELRGWAGLGEVTTCLGEHSHNPSLVSGGGEDGWLGGRGAGGPLGCQSVSVPAHTPTPGLYTFIGFSSAPRSSPGRRGKRNKSAPGASTSFHFLGSPRMLHLPKMEHEAQQGVMSQPNPLQLEGAGIQSDFSVSKNND